MSEALYQHGGLRFWSEEEIEFRNLFLQRIIFKVRQTLREINSAWSFHQIEGPCLTPKEFVNPNYTDKDIFTTNHKDFVLRPETTTSSYLYAKKLNKYPCCVYQIGKSFRRELNDGASASKLRFNEFWQLEFQCVYTNSTKADYRSLLIKTVSDEIERFTIRNTRTVDTDRLPSYSESTIDIEVYLGDDKWREVTSCSIRKDFSEEHKVCEIAIGLDRIVALGLEK